MAGVEEDGGNPRKKTRWIPCCAAPRLARVDVEVAADASGWLDQSEEHGRRWSPPWWATDGDGGDRAGGSGEGGREVRGRGEQVGVDGVILVGEG